MIKMKVDLIWMKSMELGSRSGCHQRADRSFSIGNYQFPVCARCTGILISTIIVYIFYFTRKMEIRKYVWMIIPMIIDGTLQYLGICESNNKRRFITGLLGGFGCTCIRLNLFMNLIHKINKILGVWEKS